MALLAVVAAAASCGGDARGSGGGGGVDDVAVVVPDGLDMVGPEAVGLEPLADLGQVSTDRRADVAVGPGGLVTFAGVDFGLGNAEVDLAVSTDDGRSFSRLPFEPRLSDIGVVVGDDEVLVVGSPCAEPDGSDEDAVCAPAEPSLSAYALDLGSGEGRELPEPPIVGFVTDSVGEVDGRSAVIVSADAGPTLLAWSDDQGWSTNVLPTETTRVCTSGGVLTAITNGQSLTASAELVEPPLRESGPFPVAPPPPIEPVPAGQPLWSAHVSQDGGQTWGDAVPFPAGQTRDFGFALSVACGPEAVLVHTAQVAVFDPEVREWTIVDLGDGAPVGLGGEIVWVGDDAVRVWPGAEISRPVEEGKGTSPLPVTASTVKIVNLLGDRPTVETTASGLPPGVTPSALRGAGATSTGFVLLVGETFQLARAV